MSLWKELKRRNVYKVGVAYAIVAWLIIQAAAIVSPALQLPKWTLPLVIIFLSIGFIVTLFLAWAYEVTPEGIKRTKQVPLAESITHLTGQKLNYIVTGLLVLAVGFLAVKVFFLDRRAVEPDVANIEPEQVPVVSDVEEAHKTIAVIPFVNRSSEKEQEYFVDGLSDEIITILSQISDLQVTSSTSSFTFKGSDRTIQEIAETLGVAYILEGSVRKAGNELRITAQLIQVADDRHLWSQTYERELKDIFVIQEDIATIVANELKVKLGIDKAVWQLGGTDNVEAYEKYLVAKGLSDKMGTGDLTEEEFFRAFDLLDAAIALDSKFALPWVLKSDLNQISSILLSSGDQASDFIDAALSSAQRAIELEPDLAAGFYELGFVKLTARDFIGAEEAFQHALDLEDGRLSNFRIGTFYNIVGNFEKAKEIHEEILRNDPLNPQARMNYIVDLALLDDIAGAEKEFEHGSELFGDMWQGNSMIVPIHLGVGVSLSKDDIPLIPYIPISNKVREYLESPEEGLIELRRFYSDENNLTSINSTYIASWAAYFGDPEFAMDAIEAGGGYIIWLPLFHELRQTPRFKEYLKDIGLVDYWNEYGWPDLCRPLDNGDFECD